MTDFIRRGHPQFKTPVSQGILIAVLAASVIQLVVTGIVLVRTG